MKGFSKSINNRTKKLCKNSLIGAGVKLKKSNQKYVTKTNSEKKHKKRSKRKRQ